MLRGEWCHTWQWGKRDRSFVLVTIAKYLKNLHLTIIWNNLYLHQIIFAINIFMGNFISFNVWISIQYNVISTAEENPFPNRLMSLFQWKRWLYSFNKLNNIQVLLQQNIQHRERVSGLWEQNWTQFSFNIRNHIKSGI